MILSLQETTWWDVDNLFEFVRINFSGRQIGSTTLFVSSQICNVQKSWCVTERFNSNSLRTSDGHLRPCPGFCKKTSRNTRRPCKGLTKVMLEGRKGGARRFFLEGDLNVELRFQCKDEDEEMKETSGPQCWDGIDSDPGAQEGDVARYR